MKKEDIVKAWETIREDINPNLDDVLDFMKNSAIEKAEMLNWCNKIDYKAMFGENQLDQHNLHDLSFQEKPYGFIPTKKSDYDGTKSSLFLNDEIAHWEKPKNSNYPRYTIGYSKFSNLESYSLVAQRSEDSELQFIASKVNVNNISKTFKEDLLAMARVLGANFLEEK
tara:strand:+ start:59 stop:565 length:507 start_codon:yes stop_codon:yes gene_type:complete